MTTPPAGDNWRTGDGSGPTRQGRGVRRRGGQVPRPGRRRGNRRRLGRPRPGVRDARGRCGLATGSSMRAAVEALRRRRPAAIEVAVPAAPESTCRELNALADKVVCATTPSPFFAVGESYWDFTQTTDEEVRDLLRAAPGSGSRARPRRSWCGRTTPTSVTPGPPRPRPAASSTSASLSASGTPAIAGWSASPPTPARSRRPGLGGAGRAQVGAAGARGQCRGVVPQVGEKEFLLRFGTAPRPADALRRGACSGRSG